MNGFLAFAASAVIVVPILLWVLLRRTARYERPLYRRRASLFSTQQKALYAALRQAVGRRYEVVGKVPVADLIQPVDGTLDRVAQRAYDRVGASCFTFVLCQPGDLGVVAGLYLVDQACGDTPSGDVTAALRDLCDASGLPLIVIEAAPVYAIDALRDTILAALQSEPAPEAAAGGRREPLISSLDDLDLH